MSDERMPHAFIPCDHEKEVDALIKSNPDKWRQAVINPTLFGWFIGHTMKATHGKASPAVVNDILKRRAQDDRS